jgi:NAD(P)-dependent dehydrogenase (short-subunit alcohol dehydrogenase family)
MTRKASALLEGKVVFVTGGGSGIGRSTCLLLGLEGARVAVVDRDIAAAASSAAELKAAGSEAIAIEADVSSEAQVAAAVEKTVATFGALDGAFNNAGIGTAAVGSTGKALAQLDLDAWQRTIAVNLTGVFICMKHQLAAMVRSQRPGAIVNMSSIGGLAGLRGSSAYVASKHGVIGLTKTAAIEYGAAGIRVNAVCPGHVDTPMVATAAALRGAPTDPRNQFGRLALPGEIAELVVWLLSERASFVTGATYLADGGRLAG